MDIAVVLSKFPCTDEAFILRELAALERRGFRLSIHSLRPPPDDTVHAEAARLRPRVRYLPFLWSRRVWAANLALLFRRPLLYGTLLAAVIRENRRSFGFLWRSLAVFPKAIAWGVELARQPVDRIHAHWATYPATAAWLMHRISGIPFTITAHAHDIYLDQSMLPLKVRAAETVVTCTGQNAEFLRRLVPDLPAHRIRLSYHGVDLRAYRPAPRLPGRFRILAVGTLLPRKGFDVLVDACAVLRRWGVEAECRIAGAGPLRPALEERIARLGLAGDVRLLGRKSQEELPGLYRESSVLVMPALQSPRPSGEGGRRVAAADAIHFGIPNVILEAMACGIPVLASPLPALPEVLDHGRNGLFVPEGNPEALAAALRGLAGDRRRLEEMGRRAVERIRRGWDLEATASEVARVLRGGRDGGKDDGQRAEAFRTCGGLEGG